MMNDTSRILAVSLSSRGFGYAVMEGADRLVAYGNKRILKYKNPRAVAQIKKIVERYEISQVVLKEVNAKGSLRHPRIKALDLKIAELMKKRHLAVARINGAQLSMTLLGNRRGTKGQMAESIATMFPDELASRLPPKRKIGNSEDVRMDIFDALALAVIHLSTRYNAWNEQSI